MLMIGIRQFFTRQNFPNPDSSKFSTVKILRRTVVPLINNIFNIRTMINISLLLIPKQFMLTFNLAHHYCDQQMMI